MEKATITAVPLSAAEDEAMRKAFGRFATVAGRRAGAKIVQRISTRGTTTGFDWRIILSPPFCDSHSPTGVGFRCTRILVSPYPPASGKPPWLLDAALWNLDAKNRVGTGYTVAFRCRILI